MSPQAKKEIAIAVICTVLGFFAGASRASTLYGYAGINEGLYRNSEDGRPWLQAGMGRAMNSSWDGEVLLTYLGNDSHYESSRTRGISVSALPRRGSVYGRVGVLAYKNVWHTYNPDLERKRHKGHDESDYYREENRSGVAPLLGAGYRTGHAVVELIYYFNAGQLAGSREHGVLTLNVGGRF